MTLRMSSSREISFRLNARFGRVRRTSTAVAARVRLRIGGYAKADFIQDLDYVGDRFEFELATIPVAGTDLAALDGRTTAHAKETRINFDFRGRAVNKGRDWDFPLQVFLEFDFFEDSESLYRQPRLRHAYGVIGRLLPGQTWTTSGDLEALAGTIDFSGGDALYGDRVGQIRWADRINEHLTYAVAVEEPKTSIDNPFGLDGVDRPKLPNFAGHIRLASTGGSHLQFGADVFQLTWQGGPRALRIRRSVMASISPDGFFSASTAGTRSWPVGR